MLSKQTVRAAIKGKGAMHISVRAHFVTVAFLRLGANLLSKGIIRESAGNGKYRYIMEL